MWSVRGGGCKIGTYVHGLAGDFARKKQGVISMTAGDIISNLPLALRLGPCQYN